jgi:hypothetical protein
LWRAFISNPNARLELTDWSCCRLRAKRVKHTDLKPDNPEWLIAESQAENRLSLLLAFPLVKKFSIFSRLDTDYADFVPNTHERGFLKYETIL